MSDSKSENVKVIKNNIKVGKLLVLLGGACSILCLFEGIFAPTIVYSFCGFGLSVLFIAFAVFSWVYTSHQRIEYTDKVICIKNWNKENEINISSLESIAINVSNYNGHSILNWYFDTNNKERYQVEIDYDLNSKEIKNFVSDLQMANPDLELSYTENEYRSGVCC